MQHGNVNFSSREFFEGDWVSRSVRHTHFATLWALQHCGSDSMFKPSRHALAHRYCELNSQPIVSKKIVKL